MNPSYFCEYQSASLKYDRHPSVVGLSDWLNDNLIGPTLLSPPSRLEMNIQNVSKTIWFRAVIDRVPKKGIYCLIDMSTAHQFGARFGSNRAPINSEQMP